MYKNRFEYNTPIIYPAGARRTKKDLIQMVYPAPSSEDGCGPDLFLWLRSRITHPYRNRARGITTGLIGIQ